MGKAIEKLEKKLSEIQTNPEITKVIWSRLRTWTRDTPKVFIPLDSEILAEGLGEQDEIL